MKKSIGIMIIILLILAIIVLSIIIIYYKKENIIENSEWGKSATISVTNENGNIIKYPDNRSNCFTVIRLVNEYMNYVVGENTQKLINITYSGNVTENNIIEKVKDAFIQYSENYEIILNKIYMSEAGTTFQTYFIDLLYYNEDNNQKYTTKLMVQLDIANSTYQIMPYQYMKEKGYDKLTIGDNFNEEITKIENKQDNVYSLVPISKDSMAERYFNLYAAYLKNDKEESYYLLNEDYREKRFGNIEEYVKYITENDLENMVISKYQIIEYNDYIQYVCIDSSGNYYIFNENSVMNFDLILDTYTIDLPEFVEKYNIGTEQQKVALNIDRFMQAINSKDYKYAYNCLADSFKNNYFKTQAEFETYVQANFYTSNTVSYNEFDTQGEYYTYSIVLTDKETSEQKTKTFIMQLGDGTDFVLSFDM